MHNKDNKKCETLIYRAGLALTSSRHMTSAAHASNMADAREDILTEMLWVMETHSDLEKLLEEVNLPSLPFFIFWF